MALWDGLRALTIRTANGNGPDDRQDERQLPVSASDEEFPWRGNVVASTDLKSYWYPIALSKEVTNKHPHGVRILGEPIVLYRDGSGSVRALHDRCLHKNVQLSVGRIDKGQLECFYHGWKFDGETGAVTDVPSNPKGCQLPKQRVKTFPVQELYNVVWIWPGDPDLADPAKIPRHPIQETPGFHRQEICVDLPVEHSHFVENLMDMAHTPFAHHGVFNHRSDADALDPKWRMTAQGMEGFVDNFWTDGCRNNLEFAWTAPVTNEVRLKRINSSWRLHMFFYATPIAPGQCRHIFVMYRNWGWFINWIPQSMRLWLDLGVIHGDTVGMLAQQRNMREGAPPITVATPSDEMASKYRNWLSTAMRSGGDKDNGKGPWWRGWNGKLDIEDLSKSCAETSNCYADGSYERAAASLCSTTDSRHLSEMWKVQKRWRPPLGFEQRSTCSPCSIVAGFAAGAIAALIVQRKR
jgi:phenylpropionate dioxygenase-like ring-hydroxylating dioxygenase large terminal subunit